MPRYLTPEELREEREIKEEIRHDDELGEDIRHDHLSERLYELWDIEMEREQRAERELNLVTQRVREILQQTIQQEHRRQAQEERRQTIEHQRRVRELQQQQEQLTPRIVTVTIQNSTVPSYSLSFLSFNHNMENCKKH